MTIHSKENCAGKHSDERMRGGRVEARAEGRSFSRLRPAGSCSGLPSPRGRPGGLLGGPRGRRIIAY